MRVKEIGNLTADPVYGEKDDLKYCNFKIAINDPFNKDNTEFVRVSAFDRQAEVCRDFLQKGSQVCVEGTVRARAYLDGNGEPQAQLQINAREVQFLNRIKRREQQDGHDAIDNALDKSDFEGDPAQRQEMEQGR
jgi:single stranded DNA-binding protein